MVDRVVNSTVDDADVVIVGVPFDLTSSFAKGADGAPDAIRTALDEQIEFYERFTKLRPAEQLRIAYELLDCKDCTPEQMVAKTKDFFTRLHRPDRFIITLGGEHSVTNGPLEAIADPTEITVLQIDAHLDLRHDDSDYNETPWGIYAHSTVMRRAVEKGFRILPVGIRAYHYDIEMRYAQEKGIQVFEWGIGDDPKIEDVIWAIPTQKVYLTIDVDGFDPPVMPATGTPVPDGLTWRYGTSLIRRLFRSKEVVGADIVEVIPRENDMTVYNAAQLLYNMIALWQETRVR